MGLARLRAEHHADRGISSWRYGTATRRTASPGTAADCAEWARQGGKTRIVSIPKDRPPLDFVAWTTEAAIGLAGRCVRCFSPTSPVSPAGRRPSVPVPGSGHGAHRQRSWTGIPTPSCTRNSWGDAVYVVIDYSGAGRRRSRWKSSRNSARNCSRPSACRRRTGCGSACTMGRSSSISTPCRAPGPFTAPKSRWRRGSSRASRSGPYFTTQPFAAMIESDQNDYQLRICRKDGPRQKLWRENTVPAWRLIVPLWCTGCSGGRAVRGSTF